MFKFKRLKIVEQIGIVFFFAVLIPMTISGFIINNVNQQSLRSQLRESAVLIANMVSAEVDFLSKTDEELSKELFHSLQDEKRQIYVITNSGLRAEAGGRREADARNAVKSEQPRGSQL